MVSMALKNHKVMLWVSVLGLLLLATLWPSRAQAQAGAPFFCDAQFYQIRSNNTSNNTYLVRYPTFTTAPNNPYGGATALTPALNSLAFNPRDNYLYALGVDTTPDNVLYRIGQSGLEAVGTIGGLPANYGVTTGAVFDKQGRYYMMGQGAGNQIVPSAVFRIDNIPVTGAAALTVAKTYALSGSLTNVGDFAFSDAADGINGTLYGATNQGTNTLARITLNDAASTAALATTTWASPNIGGIGSAFYDRASNQFYVFNNGTSNFYEITNFAAGTPVATTVTAIAPTFIPGGYVSNATDGASCILATVQQANIGIAKSIAPTTTVTGGQTVTFTLVVSNIGPSPAGTTTVSDNLPAGLTFVGASTAAGTYTSASGNWVLPSLPANTSRTLTLVATVNTTGTGTTAFANVATVGQAQATGTTTVVLLPDPSTANNTSTATASVVRSANLQITKTDGLGTVTAGSTTTYTLTVANLGPFAVANALLTDPVTPGLSCTAAPTCVVVTAPATCPVVGAGAGQLSIANLQGAGVQIPNLSAGGRLAIRVTCGVTATGQ